MKRICFEYKGMRYVSNLYTKKALRQIMSMAQKVEIDIADSNIEKFHEVYDTMEVIPEDRHNLKEWLNSPIKEFTDLGADNLNSILSEVLNASEQIEGCTPVKINVVLNDNEIVKVFLFTKTQPNEDLTNEEKFNYYTFPNSELIVIQNINKNLLKAKTFSEGFINNLISREILTGEIIFDCLNDANTFFGNILVNLLNNFEGQLLYKIENPEHQMDMTKNIENVSVLMNTLRNNDIVGIPIAVRDEIMKKVLETIKINPLDEHSNTYLPKEKIKRIISRNFSYEWTFQMRNIEVKATLSNKVLTYDKEICPHCGNVYSGELLTLPSGTMCCLNCLGNLVRNNRVLGYHSSTISNFQNSCGSSPSEKARYGIELELIRNESSNEWVNNWLQKVAPIIYSEGNLAKLEYDGSLGSNGEEMITQPLNKEFILGDKMKKWIDTCKEFYHPSRSCGLHFHVDKTALTSKQWGGVIRFVTNNYNNFVRAGIFRPTNSYNNLEGLKNLVSRYEDDEELYERFKSSSNHYYSISYSGHTGATVEFRCFDSTVEYDQFIKNIKSIMVILDNAEALSRQNNIQIKI